MSSLHAERPWLAAYEPQVPAVPPFPDVAFHSVLEAAAAAAPDYPALTCHGRILRYAELQAAVDRTVGALAADGVGAGDVVVSLLPAGPAFVTLAFAALRVGAMLVPIGVNGVLGGSRASVELERLTHLVRRLEPRVVVARTADWPSLGGLLRGGDGAELGHNMRAMRCVAVAPADEMPLLIRLVTRWRQSTGWGRFGRLESGRREDSAPTTTAWRAWLKDKRAPAELPRVAPGHVAVAFPEGERVTPFSHEQMVAGATMLRTWLTDTIPGEESWLVAAPLDTSFGFVSALGTGFMLRARLILVPRMENNAIVEGVRQMRPDYVLADVSLVNRLHPRRGAFRTGRDGPRAWIIAGRPGQSLDEADQRWADASITVRRGLAVPFAAGVVACQPINGAVVAGSVGLPLPGVEARIAPTAPTPREGETRREDRSPASGTLEIRSPNSIDPTRWMRVADDAGFGAHGSLIVRGGLLPQGAEQPATTGQLAGS